MIALFRLHYRLLTTKGVQSSSFQISIPETSIFTLNSIFNSQSSILNFFIFFHSFPPQNIHFSLSILFSILNHQSSILNFPFSIFNSQSSILHSIFNSQLSIINSIFHSQFSILNSHFSLVFRTFAPYEKDQSY